MQDSHHLEVWQRAMAYTAEVYRFSRRLSDGERYNLIAQMRRAACSVALNIAEGSGCPTNSEFSRFLSYAYRSLKEVVTCLELSQRLYPALPARPIEVLIDEGNQVSRMVHGLMKRRVLGHRQAGTLTTRDSRLTSDEPPADVPRS